MIALNNISVEFNGNVLFENISFLINKNDKIGLVGKNGAGKSTLLKILAGLQIPTHGDVAKSKDITIGYLPQNMIHQNGRTVLEEATTAFQHLLEAEKQLEHIQHQLNTRTDYDSPEYLDLIQKQSDIYTRLDMLGFDEKEGEIEKMLLNLGFEKKDFHRQTSEFSGGWRMRIELAKILLQQPDVLLLDEPTNHLDIESILWFEGFLKQFSGAIVLISHDKTFLDNVSNRTIELVNQKMYDYRTFYSHYLELRQQRIEQQQNAAKNQQKYIDKTEELINKYRAKASKASFAQSLIKKLDKIEKVEIDDWESAAIHIKFPPPAPSGKIVLSVENVEKQYDDKLIFKDVQFILTKGEKVAFVGKNGEGKSTMMKILAGKTDFKGRIQLGHNVLMGYFEQDQEEKMNPEKTVFETIDELATGEIRKNIRDLLGAFLFSNDDIHKKIKVLSGGERGRLALCKLLLQPYNLLLLDEPTNHLDIKSKEILKNALLHYEGTLIVVSHDRYFLSGLCNRIFEFKDKKIKEHLCDIDEFLQNKKINQLKELDIAESKHNLKLSQQQNKPQPSFNKNNFAAQLKKIEEQIEKTELKIKEMDNVLATPDEYQKIVDDKNFFQAYQNLKEQLNDLMKQWEHLLSENG